MALRRMKNTKEGNKCEDNSYSYVVDRICHEYGAPFTSTFLRRKKCGKQRFRRLNQIIL